MGGFGVGEVYLGDGSNLERIVRIKNGKNFFVLDMLFLI